MTTIVCAGREVDDTGQPIGEPCGRRFNTPGLIPGGYWLPNRDASEMAWQPYREPTDDEVREKARAAGWSVTGAPMCPRCRKPDPAIARGLP